MKIINCELVDAKIIQSQYSFDSRGCFNKIFETKIFEQLNLPNSISETFISVSNKNVIRGMHFQNTNPQAKFVSCIFGEIYDVIVDLRPDSPTYLKWQGFYLNSYNKHVLYVPKGFAHGFQSRCNGTIVLYNNVGEYSKEDDTGFRYNDPLINIQWVKCEQPVIMSERDKILPFLE
ncbi:dTDP-4-dehydrorhamnose 3,5-epimerase [bioreactor metagenome]|uniref:dTDP-4-dehydrorhamnose 3,5-epimerase n=1 Tax=bioreactor metagenome TaxID=1076179 RepID=A0A645FQC0_9ZZZZ|nr:dTDP-4-dehydrorhamnose 3,5-epimerase [Erysipelotrichales bacterium]